jgi:UDP-N-acetyl-D-mannosaminuronic acid dehydrogenase
MPPLAREINESMGAFTVDTIEDRIGSLDGQPVLVLGIAYRGDVKEDAFSSAFRLRDELLAAGARVFGHDPYFDADHLRGLGFEPYELGSAEPVRVAVLQAAHDEYRNLDPARLPGLELFVDGRNAVDREPFERAGVGYVGIGR